MRTTLFFETIVADATLTVLPIWFIALLLAKGLKQLDQFVRPVAGHMPPQIAHPRLLAVLLLPALCFGFGVILALSDGQNNLACDRALCFPNWAVQRRLLAEREVCRA